MNNNSWIWVVFIFVFLLGLVGRVLNRKGGARFLRLRFYVNRVGFVVGLIILGVFLYSLYFVLFVGFPE
jgi:hypothetical protein